jgi:hypothetical protein
MTGSQVRILFAAPAFIEFETALNPKQALKIAQHMLAPSKAPYVILLT